MVEWFYKLGPVGYPLLLCSIVTLSLGLERTFFYLKLRRPRTREDLEKQFHELVEQRDAPKSIRDEHLSLELEKYSRRLFRNLKWLNLVAAVAPMFGLLGTVMGMISVFKALAAHSGPIYPALLADGLWEALLTTAVGLIIALPALVVSQGFRIWGQSHLDRVIGSLNSISLSIEKAALHS